MEPTTLYITDPDPHKTEINEVSNSPINVLEKNDNIMFDPKAPSSTNRKLMLKQH